METAGTKRFFFWFFGCCCTLHGAAADLQNAALLASPPTGILHDWEVAQETEEIRIILTTYWLYINHQHFSDA